jgi:MFS family permease
MLKPATMDIDVAALHQGFLRGLRGPRRPHPDPGPGPPAQPPPRLLARPHRGAGITAPVALLVINRTEASQQGAALGAFTSFWDIGVAAGGPLAGLVAAISYPPIFWVMAGCAVLSAGLSASGMRRPKPVPAPPGATMRT